LLIIGLYNKLVKVKGHDEEDKKDTEAKRKTQAAPGYM